MTFNFSAHNTPHTKQTYDVFGEPFDRHTVLKVGDVVQYVGGGKQRTKDTVAIGTEGVVIQMTRSQNDRFDYIDWFIKVQLGDGRNVWSTGPHPWKVVREANGMTGTVQQRIRKRRKLEVA